MIRSGRCPFPAHRLQFVSGDSPQTKSGISRRKCRYFCRYGSHCPLNLVGTEASGTSVHMARSTVDNRLDTLDIGLDSTVGTSVGVGNLDTKGNALATIITLRHSLHLLSKIIKSNYAPNRRLDMIAEFYPKCKCFLQKFFLFQNIIDIQGS